MDLNQTVLLKHNLSDTKLLIDLETKQILLMKKTLSKFDDEILGISMQRTLGFKQRFLIITLFTVMFGIYAVDTAASITMSYKEPYFYIIFIGSLVWMFLLRYHFSESLNYQSSAYFELKNIIVDKERNLEVLNNMKDGLENLIKVKNI